MVTSIAREPAMRREEEGEGAGVEGAREGVGGSGGERLERDGMKLVEEEGRAIWWLKIQLYYSPHSGRNASHLATLLLDKLGELQRNLSPDLDVVLDESHVCTRSSDCDAITKGECERTADDSLALRELSNAFKQPRSDELPRLGDAVLDALQYRLVDSNLEGFSSGVEFFGDRDAEEQGRREGKDVGHDCRSKGSARTFERERERDARMVSATWRGPSRRMGACEERKNWPVECEDGERSAP